MSEIPDIGSFDVPAFLDFGVRAAESSALIAESKAAMAESRLRMTTAAKLAANPHQEADDES